MNRPEPWHLTHDAAQRYERCVAQYILGPWAPLLVETAGIVPGGLILDVACGTGSVTRIAAERAGITGKVVGRDLNPDMIAVAQTLPPPCGASIEWLTRSAVDLGLEDGSFDAALCQQGLQFFPDKLSALHEMRRVLRPGGRLALSVWSNIGHYNSAVGRAVEQFIGHDTARRFCASRQAPNRDELLGLAIGAGFCDIQIDLARLDIRLPRLDQFALEHLAATPVASLIAAADAETRPRAYRRERHASARALRRLRRQCLLSGRNIRPHSTHSLIRMGTDDMQKARTKATTRRFVSTVALALISTLSTLSLSESSRADSYPERPVKIVVPFPAGGPTDVAARLVAQALSSRLSQTVVVENLAGGGGKLGTKAVALANPDGYTLLLGGTNVNAIPASLKNLGYDPIGSFTPIAPICADTMVLAVWPRVSANTVEELVQQAKSQPGSFKFGAPQGIYTHLAGEFFKVKTGTDLLFVPYKGAAPAITDVLGGHIEMVFNNKSVLLTHIKEGKLKALAVTAEKRWPELPTIPTMLEVGIVGFPTEVSFGLLAPAGTPAAIIEVLNHAVNDGLKAGDVRANLEKLGVEPRFGSPQDFALVLAQQAKDWKTVIEATGVKLD